MSPPDPCGAWSPQADHLRHSPVTPAPCSRAAGSTTQGEHRARTEHALRPMTAFLAANHFYRSRNIHYAPRLCVDIVYTLG